jgi:hypothetical protein
LDFLRLSLKNAAASLNIPSEFVDKDYIWWMDYFEGTSL